MIANQFCQICGKPCVQFTMTREGLKERYCEDHSPYSSTSLVRQGQIVVLREVLFQVWEQMGNLDNHHRWAIEKKINELEAQSTPEVVSASQGARSAK